MDRDDRDAMNDMDLGGSVALSMPSMSSMSLAKMRGMSRWILVLLLAQCLSTPTFAQAGADAERLFREGIQALEGGRNEEAVGKLRAAYESNPSNPDFRLLYGLALYAVDNRSAEARRLMESVLEDFPEHADLQLKLLDSYLAAQDENKIPGLLTRVQPRMEQDARFAFNVVYTLVYYGQAELARTHLDQVSQRLQGEVLFLGGLVAVISGRTQEALRALELAKTHGFPPENSPQAAMLGESYFRIGAFRQAAEAYQGFLQHFPNADQYRFRLGLCYYAISDFEEARLHLARVAENSPHTPEINYYMGAVLSEMKETETARQHFETELKINPSDFKSMAKLAYLDYLEGDDEAALTRLQKASSLAPDWFETHLVYGLIYNRQGRHDKAVESLNRCVELEPNYPKAHYQLSIAYARMGDEVKAKESLERFQRLQDEAVGRALEDRGLADRPPPE
jgi:tetratricopeptide (TPR) repeat protein